MEQSISFAPHRTFRDPAGSVEVRSDGAFRSVRHDYAASTLLFLSRPLASTLVAEGRLIASEVISQPSIEQPLLLRHPRVSFPSYPWEWSPALWLAAAELTLNLCIDLLNEGWILKDATPLNVLFQGTRPVLVDVLSIEPANLIQPIWLAYGQFIRTFLLPMLGHSRLGWPLQVALIRRDGYEPEEIYSALSWRQRLRQPALTSVTLPTLLSKFTSDPVKYTASKSEDPQLARHIIHKTLTSLLARMRNVTPAHRQSTWSDYAETATHYSEAEHAAKRSFVASTLAKCAPQRVLDVGCNTGVYSLLAADAGAEVVSIDTDIQAVDRLCTTLKGSGKNILPLCVDLSHPTPSVGWENRESSSFLSRCAGHFDTVIMLAVIHHLLLRNQVPLDHIAALCNSITTRNLILEWVPPADPKFQELLRGRDALYAHITEPAFRAAFSRDFIILNETTLQNGRILFHFQRR